MSEIVFLCCYCGAKIKKNLANLKRHEKIHTTYKKVKCAAINCEKIIHMNHYWKHWEKQHKTIPMPDELKIVYVVGHQPKGYRKTSYEINQPMHVSAPEKPNNFYLLNVLGLTHKVETKYENTIAHYSMQNPFFGDLK